MASKHLYCAKRWRIGRQPNPGPKCFTQFLYAFYSLIDE